MADSKLTALSEVSTLAVDDVSYLVDVSDTTDDAAGSSRKVSMQRLGAFLNPSVCQGRLTLESGVPVSSSDQSAKTTVYFTPFNGNRIAVYDATRWKLYTFTELSLALGTLSSGKNYDIFIYDNSGTLTLELSAAWTNDTTRADALTTQDGIYVKSGATTRRYLGTIRTTSTTTTADSEATRFVWNLYNRVPRALYKQDLTDNAYTTGSWRAYNNDTANKIEWVRGLALEWMLLSVSGAIEIFTAGTTYCYLGISAEDTTATWDSSSPAVTLAQAGGSGTYTLRSFPGIGYHYRTCIQFGATGAQFYDGAIAGEFWG